MLQKAATGSVFLFLLLLPLLHNWYQALVSFTRAVTATPHSCEPQSRNGEAAELHAKAIFWREKTSIICKSNIGCHSLSFVCSCFPHESLPSEGYICWLNWPPVSMRAVVVTLIWGHTKKSSFSLFS